MHKFRRAGVFGLVWLAVGVGWAYAVDGGKKPDKAVGKVKLDSANKSQMSETKSIPLSSIVTTSPQKGMLHTKDVFPQKDPNRAIVSTNGYLRQILHDSKGGASNAFLVDATDMRSAIAASSSVFIGGRSAGTSVPINKPDPPRGNHWLVAYLGIGPSTPTWWEIEEAKVDGKRVLLIYRSAPPSPATADAHPYCYWVPLGKISPGTYEVHLFDADQKTTTLMRCVEVLSSIEKGR